MRTVTLVGAAEPVRTLVAATGARIAFEEGGLDSIRRTRVAVATAPLSAEWRSALDVFVCVHEIRQSEPFIDCMVIDTTDPGRGARFAFEYAAHHARQRVSAEPALEAAARDIARDYPQIACDRMAHPRDGFPPEEYDVVFSALFAAAEPHGCAWHGPEHAVFAALVGAGAKRAAVPRAVAMMLEHVREGMAADKIWRALRDGAVTGAVTADDVVARITRPA